VTAQHERLVEDLAAYVLESLEAPERARVETHVATCVTCTSLLREFRGVVGVLALGLDPVAAPSGAWAAIRAAARERRPRTRGWAEGVFLPRALRLARWPALAACVALLIGWNVMLQRELARRAPGPAPGPEVEALSRRPGHILVLTGTGRLAASARIFVAVDGGGHLAVSGLRALSRQRVYQLWFLPPGGAPMSAATFSVDGSGRAWVKVDVPASIGTVGAALVTEEPAPGSETPTGRPLLETQP
jgi:anti-sigma-K factor RskA